MKNAFINSEYSIFLDGELLGKNHSLEYCQRYAGKYPGRITYAKN